SFESGSVTFNHGTGSGTPQILVRIDSDPVWLEGRQGGTPTAASTGVSHSVNTYVFGFPYSLSFKAFAGTLLCWHGHGRSDSFSVQMTIANGGGGPYDPEEMLFQPTGNNSYRWNHLQGPVPFGFELHGTDSTIVSNYGANHPLAPELLVVKKPPPVKGQPLVNGPPWYSATLSQAVINSSYFGGKIPIRYYVFEVQPTGTTPTRVGPFGDWTGE
ncbi:MAG TPA: hypothetical protein VG815_13555, partial [Chloroflexota bacterium]|nr:hypothetical protein [Chloroflexota bacterium]